MEHAATGTCRAHYCFRCACYALAVRASCLVVRTTQVLVARALSCFRRALSCFPQTLSQQLTQFSPTQPLWPAPQSPLRAASQQLSPMLFTGGSPTLGCPVRGSLPVGQVQQVLFGPVPVQQQQQMQQQQVQAAAQQVGRSRTAAAAAAAGPTKTAATPSASTVSVSPTRATYGLRLQQRLQEPNLAQPKQHHLRPRARLGMAEGRDTGLPLRGGLLQVLAPKGHGDCQDPRRSRETLLARREHYWPLVQSGEPVSPPCQPKKDKLPVDTARWRSTSCCSGAGQVTGGVTCGPTRLRVPPQRPSTTSTSTRTHRALSTRRTRGQWPSRTSVPR